MSMTLLHCVLPSPADIAGCRYILINLRFRVKVPSLCCILEFRQNQIYACAFLSFHRYKGKVPAMETKGPSSFGRCSRDILIAINVLSDDYAYIFC